MIDRRNRRSVGRYLGALNLHYLWSENSGGPARPRNTGLRLPGNLRSVSRSDDWWKPRKLELCVQALEVARMSFNHDMYWPEARTTVYLRQAQRARVARASV